MPWSARPTQPAAALGCTRRSAGSSVTAPPSRFNSTGCPAITFSAAAAGFSHANAFLRSSGDCPTSARASSCSASRRRQQRPGGRIVQRHLLDVQLLADLIGEALDGPAVVVAAGWTFISASGCRTLILTALRAAEPSDTSRSRASISADRVRVDQRLVGLGISRTDGRCRLAAVPARRF